MGGFWATEKELRQAGFVRGWKYYPAMHAWVTRGRLRIVLSRCPTRARVAGRMGRVLEFRRLDELLEFIGEAPLESPPRMPVVRRAITRLPDRLEETA